MRYLSIGLALTLTLSLASSSFGAPILSLNTNTGVSAPGGNVASWTNTGTVGGAFTLTNANAAPTLIAGPNGTQVINFTGSNSLSDLSFGQSSVPEATIFIVAAVNSNNGSYNAFAAGGSGGDDYTSGFNIDQGPGSSSNLNTVNVESTKGNGGTNLLNPSTTYNFGTYHVFEVNIYNGGQQLLVDGMTQQSRGGNANALNLSDLYVGSRHYGGNNTGFFHGDIGAVQIYSGELTNNQANQIGQALGREFGIATTYTPEPSSFLLAGLGLAGLVFAGRRAKVARLKRVVPVAMLIVVLMANLGSANTLSLNFTSSIPSTIDDATGQGTGFAVRMTGTGSSLPTNDPNLTLNTGAGTLSVAATPADLNGGGGLGGGELPGTLLSSLGYNGTQDFSVSATFANVQYANNYQQFGVYVATSSTDNLRTGPLNCCSAGSREVYGVFNNGNDQGNHLSGMTPPAVGDTIQETLSRVGGVYHFSLTDLTTHTTQTATFGGLGGADATVNSALNAIGAASTLNVGIYVGNPAGGGAASPVTETLTHYSVTVTPEPGSLLMAGMAAVGLAGVIGVRRVRNG